MGTRLYVGNLSYAATDADLSNLFSEAGPVTSAEVVSDRETGRSRGFAFVEMENAEAATNAITMFNGKDFQNRSLRVNEAREREQRGSGGGGSRGGGRDRSEPRW
jgi:RNA recognition motif-containing protein